MAKQKTGKLNWLDRHLFPGLVVTAAWLEKNGFSSSLRSQYVTAGWLEQPVRGVYRRPQGTLLWEQIVISMQTALDLPVVVGGRTALELQGYAHYLSRHRQEVHLYGPRALPGWIERFAVQEVFVTHNSLRLFPEDPLLDGLGLSDAIQAGGEMNASRSGGAFQCMEWGQWKWPLTLSAPERALLELLDELPLRETFHQVDMLMDGLSTIRPLLMESLLVNCRSVKVKRLFFFFADRHDHAWRKHINRDNVALGSGKRMLVKGGKLVPKYNITVPEDFHGV